MKKIFTLLFLLVISLNIVINYKKEETVSVFTDLSNETYLLQDEKTYNLVYLDISNINLTTKKYDLIKQLEIVGVYYEISELHSKLFKTNYYEFKSNNISKNMNDLNEYYLTILKQNNLIDAENKIYINGIKLKKVKIYISNKQLYNFLNSNPQITYSFDLNNNYQSI